MDGPVDIRWHGRGGQGTATAARIAARLASAGGRHFQAFPAFCDDGPPRPGEPVVAFTRISDRPIGEHAEVGSPGIVVLLDESLLGSAEATRGLTDDALVLVNSDMTAAELRSRHGLDTFRVYSVAATAIAREVTGRDYPDTAMLGALARVSDLFPIATVEDCVRADFGRRFAREVVDANVTAAVRSYEEVRGG